MSVWVWTLVSLVGLRLLAMLLRGESGAMVRSLLAVLAALTVAAHLVIDGARWTLAPHYLLVLLLLALLIWERPHAKAALFGSRRVRRPRPYARFFSMFALWLPLLALPLLLPVPVLPAPTGAYGVGTLSFALELPPAPHQGDMDGVATGANNPRQTMVRMWYPTNRDASNGTPAPWIDDAHAVLPAMAASAGLPGFVFSHLALVNTHAYANAPLAPASSETNAWPLVTFNHGLGGWRTQNTFLAEELASHGAVVVALDHPGDALGTTLPDGTTLAYVGLPSTRAPGYAQAVVAMGARWQFDTLALLAALQALEPEGPLGAFAGAIDFDRVLSIGHSTGGGVALEVCHALPGCGAALALDPWWGPVNPERLAAGSDRPLVVVDSDPALAYFAASNLDRFRRFAEASSAPIVPLLLEDGGHHNVNDTMLFTFSAVALQLGHNVGPVNAYAAMTALRTLAVALLQEDAFDAERVRAVATLPLREVPVAAR